MTTAGVVRVAIKFPGGAGLQKSFKVLPASYLFKTLVSINGTAMTKITKGKVLSKQYFGNPDDPDSVGISSNLYV